jgi:ketosteroid isomerase-like protein
MTTAPLKDQSSKDEAAIRALIDTVHKAHHSKNAAAIVAPYDPDAVVFTLAPPLSRRAVDFQGELKAWLDTWEGPVELETRDFSITVSADLAFCYGFYRLSGVKSGAGPQSVWMRATVCLRRTGGAWRIVHEHTSVPFYMDGSYRAAVDLKP